MKKVLAILSLTIIVVSTKAQTTEHVISDLHVLLSSAKTNFKDDMGEKILEDTANNIIWYQTKYGTDGAKSLIRQKLDDNTYTYAILYNTKGIDANTSKTITNIVDLYIGELNVMVKSGNYTGRDYNGTDGYAVTEIKDKNGNIVLEYHSNEENQNIYIYSVNNTKK